MGMYPLHSTAYSYQSHSKYTPMYSVQFLALATVATRMHIHLWQTNQHLRGSSGLVHIPLSDMSYVNITA
ncbi:hypothetical protein BDR06DRAFT_955658 [Suillus hirtellus]|nr:hypothetical protein BDR06DRAFT_955658 [Suillus hirtellus]